MALLPDLTVSALALAFAVMGIGSLVAPTLVSRQFGITTLNVDGRNEVRAVYGGFGLAVSAILVLALVAAELRAGICVTVGAALAGMAAGRLISSALDRALGRMPAFYLVIEGVGAAALVYAA